VLFLVSASTTAALGWQSGSVVNGRQEPPRPARSCSSTTPGRRCRCIHHHTGEIHPMQPCIRRCASVPPATPSPKPPGSQKLPGLAGAPPRCFAFIGGGAGDRGCRINLRSAVSKSHRYEPDINPATATGEHYGVAGGAAGHVSRATKAKAGWRAGDLSADTRACANRRSFSLR